jgi:hypothetical protein
MMRRAVPGCRNVAAFIWYIATVLEPVGDSAGLAEALPLIGLILVFVAVMIAYGGLTPDCEA